MIGDYAGFATAEEAADAERLNDLAIGAVVESGAELLDTLAEFIRRYVSCSPAALDVGALWVLHTHAFDAADASPRLAFLSSEPQSGKSRYLEVLKLVVRAPLFAVNISEAALFRVIEARRPTILHDEIDAVFGPKARDREDLRGMLNAGYERGANVERCVGDGAKMTTKPFSVFAPVALAGLGKLPETLEQRSIVVRMKRRTANEPVAKLRRRHVEPEADILRARGEAWATANVSALAAADPEMPEELSDRAEDIWAPLVAIADLAGGDWPQRARTAALELFTARRDDEASIGVRLLADICKVLGTSEGLASGDLAKRLADIEGAPWPEWSDKGFSPHALAKLLRRYDIQPDLHWVGNTKIRGYVASDFADAFSRYLTPPAVSVPTDSTVPPQSQQGQGPEHSERLEHFPGMPPGLERLDLSDPSERLAHARAVEVLRRRHGEEVGTDG